MSRHMTSASGHKQTWAAYEILAVLLGCSRYESPRFNRDDARIPIENSGPGRDVVVGNAQVFKNRTIKTGQ